MSGFALNLDLSYYFEDLRKFSCVFVDVTKSKIVGDVENHIKAVFKLDDNICLTSKKFLIPRCENIKILQQYEILKVQKCDFFDYQIHQDKTENAACDENHTALNLIQSERSIDLSCRPKQRLKINMCKSLSISGASLFPLTQNHKMHNISFPSTSSSGGVTQSKEKSKHKKKKSQVNEVDNGDENGVDILDMSLNKPDTCDYNCFEIDHDEEVDPTHSRSINCENNIGTLTQESGKKSKKRTRKKQNNCNELHDVDEFEASSYRKKKKKSSKYDIDAGNEAEDYTTSAKLKEITDLSLDYSAFGLNPNENNVRNSTFDDLGSKRKQHKKVKDFVDNKCISDESKHKKVKESVENRSINSECNSMTESDTGISSNKKKPDNHIKQYNLNGTTNHSINEEAQVETKNHSNTTTEDKHINCSESNNNRDSVTYSEFLEPELKNKRIRRHRKRHKQGKRALSQSMLSAVGPILGMLDGHSVTVPVVHQVTTPRTGQHIYFNDNDFDDEMIIPSTPPNESSQPQEYSSQTPSNTTPGIVNRDGENDLVPTWKQQLLKLASSTKPLVFHRETCDRVKLDASKTNGDIPIPANKLDYPVKLDLPKPAFFENTKPFEVKISTNDKHEIPSQCLQKPQSSVELLIQQENANMVKNNKCTNSRENVDESSNLHNGNDKITGCSDCNGDIKSLNRTCSEIHNSTSATRKLSESVPLIPNDIQSITLSNYPIIDKVISGDFILFKVLKLSDQNQPNCSKTILAKVNSTTEFPDKISLHIIEGFEECDLTNKAVENGENVIVQLRWIDIIEPRLFYP